MASVPGGFGDHAQVDESQADGADDVVFDDVIECEAGCQFVRPSTCCRVFGDHLGEGFIVGDVEAAVASDGVPVACGDAYAYKWSLKPDACGRSAVLEQRGRRGQRRNQPLAGWGVGEMVDSSHEFSPVQCQGVL